MDVCRLTGKQRVSSRTSVYYFAIPSQFYPHSDLLTPYHMIGSRWVLLGEVGDIGLPLEIVLHLYFAVHTCCLVSPKDLGFPGILVLVANQIKQM